MVRYSGRFGVHELAESQKVALTRPDDPVEQFRELGFSRDGAKEVREKIAASGKGFVAAIESDDGRAEGQDISTWNICAAGISMGIVLGIEFAIKYLGADLSLACPDCEGSGREGDGDPCTNPIHGIVANGR